MSGAGSRVSFAAETPQVSESGYHGPTSVMFDQALEKQRGDHHVWDRNPTDTEHARCSLVAETSKQRQLELVNLSTGCLDFDGVVPEIGMELLSIFWARHLHAGLIVYRTAFMRGMATGGPFFSKLLLNAIYYASSKHSSHTSIRTDPEDRATAGWSFRKRFDELLRASFDKSQITTIQALLIMASSLFTRCDERSVSWLYAGNAFNMIVDLGIHVESSSGAMSPEEREIRRRVYWGAYLIDKTQCLYQGRHPCLLTSETNVPLVFLDDHEELEMFATASFCDSGQEFASPSYQMTTLAHLCRLSIVMERIHSKIYAIKHLNQTPSDLYKDTLDLQEELEGWRRNLPPRVDFIGSATSARPLPYDLGMLATYNVLVILVHRLLLSESAPSSGPIRGRALATCWRAANEIAQILTAHEEVYKPFSETFGLCYAAYVAATIQVHILTHHGDQFSALSSLRTCLSCLDQQLVVYSAAKRAREIIAQLMDRAEIRLCACGELVGRCQHPSSFYPCDDGSLISAEVPSGGNVLPDESQPSLAGPSLDVPPTWEPGHVGDDATFQYFQRLFENSATEARLPEYPSCYDL